MALLQIIFGLGKFSGNFRFNLWVRTLWNNFRVGNMFKYVEKGSSLFGLRSGVDLFLTTHLWVRLTCAAILRIILGLGLGNGYFRFNLWVRTLWNNFRVGNMFFVI